MFLGAYTFDGDLDELRPAYARLVAGLPPDLTELHVCVERPRGLIVLDACPSAEVFREFSTGPDFAAAVRAAGLPTPEVEEVGEVLRARLARPVGA